MCARRDARGLGECLSSRPRTGRKSCGERLGMRLDSTARRAGLRDRHERPDSTRTPASSPGDRVSVPDLPIERPEHRLDVRYHGLDLDDQEGRGRAVPRQNVDRTSFAADVERRLRHSLPARAPEECEEPLDQVGVIAIEEAVGRLALPVDADHEPRIEGSGDAFEGVEPELARPAALDASNQRLRHGGSIREVDLAPTPMHADRPNDASNPNGIHLWSMDRAAHPGITRALG